jgi:hypothetical protein
VAGILLAQLFLIPITYIPSASAVACSNADYGQTQACAAPSAQAIKDRTGTNTDGLYWIYVNGVATQVYSIMNSAITPMFLITVQQIGAPQIPLTQLIQRQIQVAQMRMQSTQSLTPCKLQRLWRFFLMRQVRAER